MSKEVVIIKGEYYQVIERYKDVFDNKCITLKELKSKEDSGKVT